MTRSADIQTTDQLSEQIHCTTATHPGAARANNQDALLSRPDLGLWAVADGAGGHSGGEIAARTVVAALDAIPPGLNAQEMLIQVRVQLARAHHALRTQATSTDEGLMASTVVVLIVRGDHFACLWAGDSRAYLARAGVVDQLTTDHSLVQQLLEHGAIDPADAHDHPDANVITRAVGAGETEPELDKRMGPVVAGDRFLLCSDGVCKMVPMDVLARSLREGAIAQDVVAATLALAPSDNVTVVTVDVLDGGPAG